MEKDFPGGLGVVPLLLISYLFLQGSIAIFHFGTKLVGRTLIGGCYIATCGRLGDRTMALNV